MTTSNSFYLGELRTESVHILSGTKIITDAPPDNNGKGEAFSPTDLVCTALCNCMITIMGISAAKKNLDLSGLSATVTKVMSSSPRKISEIHINFELHNPGLSTGDKTALKNAALTCPVALSLNPEIKQNISFNF